MVLIKFCKRFAQEKPRAPPHVNYDTLQVLCGSEQTQERRRLPLRDAFRSVTPRFQLSQNERGPDEQASRQQLFEAARKPDAGFKRQKTDSQKPLWAQASQLAGRSETHEKVVSMHILPKRACNFCSGQGRPDPAVPTDASSHSTVLPKNKHREKGTDARRQAQKQCMTDFPTEPDSAICFQLLYETHESAVFAPVVPVIVSPCAMIPISPPSSRRWVSPTGSLDGLEIALSPGCSCAAGVRRCLKCEWRVLAEKLSSNSVMI